MHGGDGMAGCVMHQVDEIGLNKALTQAGLSTSAMVVRLAWLAGLSRQELQNLAWSQVDLPQNRLRLPQRTIALQGDLPYWLTLWQSHQSATPWVLPGQRGQLSPPSISRLAQQFFTAHGLEPLRLADLRHSYICTQLSHRSWGDVCHELACHETALRQAYGDYVTPPAVSSSAQLTPETIHRLLTAHPPSLGLLAVALAWEEGLSPTDLRALTWSELATLPSDGQAFALAQILRQGDGLVFDVSAPHLSRLGRQTLLLEGLDGITLQTLSQARPQHVPQLMALLSQHQGVSIKQVAQACQLSKAHNWLRTLCNAGILVQVGMYYYDARHVPPRAQHAPLLLAYAQRQGTLYTDDVMRLLHLRPSQCRQLLHSMVDDGSLEHKGLGYGLTKN